VSPTRFRARLTLLLNVFRRRDLVANVSLTRLGPTTLGASALIGMVVAFPLAGMVLLGMEHVLHVLLTIGFAAVAVEALTNPKESPGCPTLPSRCVP
jgi:hypothetical protein